MRNTPVIPHERSAPICDPAAAQPLSGSTVPHMMIARRGDPDTRSLPSLLRDDREAR